MKFVANSSSFHFDTQIWEILKAGRGSHSPPLTPSGAPAPPSSIDRSRPLVVYTARGIQGVVYSPSFEETYFRIRENLWGLETESTRKCSPRLRCWSIPVTFMHGIVWCMGVVAFLTHIASSSGSTGALCDLVVDIVRYALGALVAKVVICCVQAYCSRCATCILFWFHRCVMRSCCRWRLDSVLCYGILGCGCACGDLLSFQSQF